MTALLIVYDLNSSGQNYQLLTNKIEQSFAKRWRFQRSAWLVESSVNEYDVASMLEQCIDSNDTLFVTRASSTSAWCGYTQEGTDWITSVL